MDDSVSKTGADRSEGWSGAGIGEGTIAYYVSAHGYGHGVRSSEVIRALHETSPNTTIWIATELSPEFLRSRLPRSFFESDHCRFRTAALDVGMVQLDSIRVDLDATRERVGELVTSWDLLRVEEEKFLQSIGAGAVVADIPAIPIEAAAALGIPSVAVGNFAWDWIYSEFSERSAGADPVRRANPWRAAVRRFGSAYGQTDLLLRLPFAEPMAAFPRQLDLPLLSHPGRDRRSELVERYGCDPKKRWILLSFTSLEWDAAALDRVESFESYEFLSVRPLQWPGRRIHGVDPVEFPFSDVLQSVDGVISKPGFGIVSESIANGKPLLYADRSDFREYPILVRAIESYLQNRHIDASELYSGNLGGALDRLFSARPARDSINGGGAEAAAREILQIRDSRRALE